MTGKKMLFYFLQSWGMRRLMLVFHPCCRLKMLKFLRMNQVCQLLLSTSRNLCIQNVCMKELVTSTLEAGCVSLYVNFPYQWKFSVCRHIAVSNMECG